jgi:hypothetical protein
MHSPKCAAEPARARVPLLCANAGGAEARHFNRMLGAPRSNRGARPQLLPAGKGRRSPDPDHAVRCGDEQRAVSSRSVIPVAVGPPAMPVEMIVNPAGVGAVWRPPEGPPPHCADNAADHGTNRSGDHQAGPRTGDRADRIRLRNGRSNSDCENRNGSQQTLAHGRPPLGKMRNRSRPRRQCGKCRRVPLPQRFRGGCCGSNTLRLVALRFANFCARLV